MSQQTNHDDAATLAGWLASLCTAIDQGSTEAKSDALRDAGRIFKSIADGLPVNIVIKDIHGRRVFVNRGYLELYQARAQEILGRTDADLFPQELARKYHEDDAKVLRTGAVLRGTEEIRLPDGRRRLIERIKAPLRDASGTIVGLEVVFWDVTERVATKESLNLEQRLLTSLMDSIPDAI